MSTLTPTWKDRLETVLWYGYTGLIAFFLALPVLAIIIASFYEGQIFALPYEFSLKWYEAVLTSSGVRSAVITTLLTSLPVMVLSTVIGTAAALGYTRYDFTGKEYFKIFALLPIFFPLILLGLGMSMWFHLTGLGTGLVPTIIGQTVWISPIVMFVVSLRALSIDPNIEDAAKDLGAGQVTMYKDVILPPILDGVIAGAIFAFVLSWNNYYIASYLLGPNNSITTWIHGQLGFSFAPLVPAVASVIFYVSTLLVVIALSFLWWWGGSGGD